MKDYWFQPQMKHILYQFPEAPKHITPKFDRFPVKFLQFMREYATEIFANPRLALVIKLEAMGDNLEGAVKKCIIQQ